MAFKIKRTETYKTQIAVTMPNAKGKVDTEKFFAIFKRVGLDRLNELRLMKHSEVLEEVLVGWEEMVDEDNDPVEYSDENRRALFDIPQAFDALVTEFWASIFGAKKGN